MCIIAAKPANTKMPPKDIIENMWYSNRDGAGIMYALDGKVHIEKGLMTLKDFQAKLEELRVKRSIDLDAVPVVMHFRITTHGGTCPANTHPFPVTDSVNLLQRTSVSTVLGVAHNGIIPITPRKGISDTMEYIASQLAPLNRALPGWYHSPDALTLVRNGIQSKLAVLTGTGEIITIGDFVTADGIKYSNTSFTGYGRYSRMFDDDLDPWENFTYSGKYYKTEPKTGKSAGKSTAKAPAKTTKTKSVGSGKGKTALSVTRKPLMWLADAYPNAYVYTATGAVVEGEDFLIDSDNILYTYDTALDIATRHPEYTAYAASGALVHFHEDKANLEYILDPSK